ncbi:MAG: sigma-54 dependent transcriptional regulator [Victivallaceae bacterium]
MSEGLYPEMPILLVDDEKNTLRSYELVLLSAGINNIITCADGLEARQIMRSRSIELVVLDMIMPNISGMDLLAEFTRDYPEVPVIMSTCVNSLDKAVECMRLGAIDYLVKPVDIEKLINQVRNCMELRELKRENHRLQQHLLMENTPDLPEALAPIITQNKYMLSLFQYCKAVAQSKQPVLITGETGVGKELFAQALHALSKCKGEMVTVNIAGLDDNMLSDTLFGHTKGAFTGAVNNRPGMIEKASGGTLFLDEIGDLNVASQVKLLRLLQQREYSPLGADSANITTARVILATHRDLFELQHDNKFRKDLYYRISTHHIHIPPLRERKDDLPILLDTMVEKISREMNKKTPQYPVELITLLKSYHFPGNIRELEAMVYDAISSHKSKIMSTRVFSEHIARNFKTSSAYGIGGSDGSFDNCLNDLTVLPSLKEASLCLVKEAMRRSGNNQSIAARLLGITPQALSSRLKKENL